MNVVTFCNQRCITSTAFNSVLLTMARGSPLTGFGAVKAIQPVMDERLRVKPDPFLQGDAGSFVVSGSTCIRNEGIESLSAPV